MAEEIDLIEFLSDGDERPYSIDTSKTEGLYSNERAAMIAFDEKVIPAVDRTLCAQAFRVYHEVIGRYVGMWPSGHPDGVKLEHPRIDRVLVPTIKLVEAGWNLGAVGVEIKRSGVKLGPPVVQALNYMNAVFALRSESGLFAEVCLRKVFLFPSAMPHGNLGAVMAQAGVGTVRFHQFGNEPGEASFYESGSSKIISRDGFAPAKCGFRRGSR